MNGELTAVTAKGRVRVNLISTPLFPPSYQRLRGIFVGFAWRRWRTGKMMSRAVNLPHGDGQSKKRLEWIRIRGGGDTCGRGGRERGNDGGSDGNICLSIRRWTLINPNKQANGMMSPPPNANTEGRADNNPSHLATASSSCLIFCRSPPLPPPPLLPLLHAHCYSRRVGSV